MTDLLPVIVPILLVDVLNPVLLAAMIYVAGTANGVMNSAAMLLGHTLAYLLVGIVIALGIDAIAARFAEPKPVDFLFEALVGLGCLYAAWASRGGGASEERQPEGELGPVRCLLFGGVINLLGAPFAVPYIAVVSQILDADLGSGTSLAVLLAYNIAYALPFLLVPIAVARLGDAARPMLDRINDWMTRAADLVMPWMLLLLGLFLLVDAGMYFFTGAPLPLE